MHASSLSSFWLENQVIALPKQKRKGLSWLGCTGTGVEGRSDWIAESMSLKATRTLSAFENGNVQELFLFKFDVLSWKWISQVNALLSLFGRWSNFRFWILIWYGICTILDGNNQVNCEFLLDFSTAKENWGDAFLYTFSQSLFPKPVGKRELFGFESKQSECKHWTHVYGSWIFVHPSQTPNHFRGEKVPLERGGLVCFILVNFELSPNKG